MGLTDEGAKARKLMICPTGVPTVIIYCGQLLQISQTGYLKQETQNEINF